MAKSIEEILGEIAQSEVPEAPVMESAPGISGKVTRVQLNSRIKVTGTQFWSPDQKKFFEKSVIDYVSRLGLDTPDFSVCEREAREGEWEFHVTHSQKSAPTIKKIVDALVSRLNDMSKVYLQKFCRILIDFDDPEAPVGMSGLFGYFYVSDVDYTKVDKVRATHKFLLPRMPAGYRPARLPRDQVIGRQFISKMIMSSRGGDTVEPGYNKNFTLIVYNINGCVEHKDPETGEVSSIPMLDLHIVRVTDNVIGAKPRIERYNTVVQTNIDEAIAQVLGQAAGDRVLDSTTLTADVDLIYNIMNELSAVDHGDLLIDECKFIDPPMNGFKVVKSTRKETAQETVKKESVEVDQADDSDEDNIVIDNDNTAVESDEDDIIIDDEDNGVEID